MKAIYIEGLFWIIAMIGFVRGLMEEDAKLMAMGLFILYGTNLYEITLCRRWLKELSQSQPKVKK